jgi:hypothetical protein
MHPVKATRRAFRRNAPTPSRPGNRAQQSRPIQPPERAVPDMAALPHASPLVRTPATHGGACRPRARTAAAASPLALRAPALLQLSAEILHADGTVSADALRQPSATSRGRGPHRVLFTQPSQLLGGGLAEFTASQGRPSGGNRACVAYARCVRACARTYADAAAFRRRSSFSACIRCARPTLSAPSSPDSL